MIKNNVFRGVVYTFLTAMMVYAGVVSIGMMGGSLEMTAAELYTTLGYTGLLVLAGIVFFGINMLIFAINNYKQFVYYTAGKVDNRKYGKKVFAKLYKAVIAILLLAGIIVLFTIKINLIEFIKFGDIKTVVLAGLTLIAVVLLFAFEFAELIFTIKARGPKKPKAKKVKKAKQVEQPVAPKATEVQEKPVFRFGKK